MSFSAPRQVTDGVANGAPRTAAPRSSDFVDAEQMDVCGLPAFVIDSPGPLVAGLTFRVGVIDEVLPQRGVTHLVEHLVLHTVPRDQEYNGSVSLTETSFYVRGDDGEVVDFFRHVSRALRALPLERAETEARVLRTEARGRGQTPFGSLATCRFGARHAGLLEYDEYGLLDPDAEAAQAWADRWFNASNAALWFSGSVPRDLEIELVAGARHLPPPVPAPAVAVPGVVFQGRGTVAVSFPSDRSAASYFALAVLRRRLHERLRVEEGRVYAIEGTREVLSADQALVALWCKSLDTEAQAVADALRAELGALATGGPSAEALEEEASQLRRLWKLPDSLVPRVIGSAAGHLQGRPPFSPEAFLDELEALRPEQVAWALSDARDSALWLVPEATAINDKRILPVDQLPSPAIVGRSHRRRRWLDDASKNDELVVGADGICLQSGRGYRRAIRWTQCQGLIEWDDARWVVGADGFKVFVHPDEWIDGAEAIDAIDAAIPRERRVREPGGTGSAYLREVDRRAPSSAEPWKPPEEAAAAALPTPPAPAAADGARSRRSWLRR